MYQPKKSFPPGYVPQKTVERNRRLAAEEIDPEEAEEAALEAVQNDLHDRDFAE